MCKMGVILGLLGAVLLIGPAIAGTASFEVSAIRHDHYEQSIETALNEAVEVAVRTAVGMGFSWIRIKSSLVSDDSVSIEILATDTDPVAEEGTAQGNLDESQAGKRSSWIFVGGKPTFEDDSSN